MATIYTHDTTRPVVPKDEARQGEATGHVRYVLMTSLALAIIAGIVLYSAFF